MEIQTGTKFTHDAMEFTIVAVVLGAHEDIMSFTAIAFTGTYYVSRTFNVNPASMAA